LTPLASFCLLEKNNFVCQFMIFWNQFCLCRYGSEDGCTFEGCTFPHGFEEMNAWQAQITEIYREETQRRMTGVRHHQAVLQSKKEAGTLTADFLWFEIEREREFLFVFNRFLATECRGLDVIKKLRDICFDKLIRPPNENTLKLAAVILGYLCSLLLVRTSDVLSYLSKVMADKHFRQVILVMQQCGWLLELKSPETVEKIFKEMTKKLGPSHEGMVSLSQLRTNLWIEKDSNVLVENRPISKQILYDLEFHVPLENSDSPSWGSDAHWCVFQHLCEYVYLELGYQESDTNENRYTFCLHEQKAERCGNPKCTFSHHPSVFASLPEKQQMKSRLWKYSIEFQLWDVVYGHCTWIKSDLDLKPPLAALFDFAFRLYVERFENLISQNSLSRRHSASSVPPAPPSSSSSSSSSSSLLPLPITWPSSASNSSKQPRPSSASPSLSPSPFLPRSPPPGFPPVSPSLSPSPSAHSSQVPYSLIGEELSYAHLKLADLEVDPHLLCTICHHLCKDAVAHDCGKLFCHLCWMRQQLCPVCKKGGTPHEAPRFRRQIQNVNVYCPLECGATYRLLGNHRHITVECVNRIISCHSCQYKMPASTMQFHLSQQCPNRQIQCPICTAIVREKDVLAHISESLPDHVLAQSNGNGIARNEIYLLNKKISSLQDEMAKLSSEVNRLHEENSTALNELHFLKSIIEAYHPGSIFINTPDLSHPNCSTRRVAYWSDAIFRDLEKGLIELREAAFGEVAMQKLLDIQKECKWSCCNGFIDSPPCSFRIRTGPIRIYN
jgi:hypothetical protein